jgi:RHS repeat-associated protein
MFTTAGVDQTAYSYDPFGTATSTAKPTSATQPFGYTGQLTNPVLTGQQDLRARNYDPATAAFTSRDPIQVRPGKPYTSAYSYTDDAPTYRVDPSGKCWWMPGTGDAGCVNGIRDGLNLASQIDPGGPATEIRALLRSCKQGADFGRQHYSKMQYPDAMGCLGEFVGVNSIVQGAQDMSHGCTQRGEQEMGLGLFQVATLAIPAFDGAGATLNGAEDSALASAVSAPGATEKLVDQLVEQEGAAPTINDLRAKLAELMRRRMLGFDQAKNKFVRSEMETALRVESQRGVSLTRSTGTAEDWFDQYGRSYDAIGNFPGEFFDREWENLKDQTVTHLAKAQFVPVDVSQFTPAQTAMVRDFIAQFGSRVFIVSG